MVRVFGETQGIEFAQLEMETWYYIRLEYLLKAGLFSKQFHLKLWVNEKPYEKSSLPIPEINQTDELT